MPIDVALLHNAKAGDETFTEQRLVRLLKRAGYRPKYFSLKKAFRNRKALEHGEFVIAAGGDGSIRRVALELIGRKRVLAPLPLGTANNIARSLGVATDAEEAIAGWAAGVRRKIDVGVARGPWGKRTFIEGLGLGLLGRAIAIIEEIDETSGRVFSTTEDKLHRDLCVMMALAAEMPATDVKLMRDGEKKRDEFLLFEVLNINRAGPGIELAKSADPGDGWLDVVSATAGERRKLTRSIEKCLSESRRGPFLRSHKARRLRLALCECEVRLDDEVVLHREDFADVAKNGRVKIDIEVKRGALEFLVPAKAGGRASDS